MFPPTCSSVPVLSADKTATWPPRSLSAQLLEHTSRAVKPYKEKTIKSRAKGKSRLGSDEAFEAERAWIEEKLGPSRVPSRPLPKAGRADAGALLYSAREAEVAAEKARDERLQQEAEDTGVGFECGCCYSLFPFEKAVQCGDGT